jgi:hypothetical protein
MAKKNLDRAPQLGVFWLVNGKLIIDSSLQSESEPYGDHLTHPRSHIRVWAKLRRSGRVPRGSEYDEYPRGRVMHHPASGEFTIFADRCILKRRSLIAQIKKALHLSKKVKTGTDPHYRCPLCLQGKQINEEEDWEE